MFGRLKRIRRARSQGNLDDVLAHWSPADPITVRMMCENILICGKTGSGKSSGAGDFLLRALIRYPNSSGLWLAAKPEDRDYALRLFREERTLNDLYIIERGGRVRFNQLDYERSRGADVSDLTNACMSFQEPLSRAEGGGSGKGGDDAAHWAALQRMMLHNAIQILLLAHGRISGWDIQAFITGAAMSLDETNDDRWKNDFHNQTLLAAKRNVVSDLQKDDFELAEQYWRFNLPRMNDRTRTSIESGVLSILHAMNTGTSRDILSTSSEIDPGVLERRKWIFCNFPVVPGDITAPVVSTGIKTSVQRHVLRRKVGPEDPIICIYSDEFQKLSNPMDGLYLAECRSHKGCLIALTQSVHSMYANLGGKGGDHQTDSLLTNFGHICIHTVGDAKTAKNWSDVLGVRRELFISTSLQPNNATLFDQMMGHSNVSVSANEKYEPVIQPSIFTSGLRCGGTDNGNVVDGVIIRAGKPFTYTGENYLIKAFKQR